jgi:hypothetical protein
MKALAKHNSAKIIVTSRRGHKYKTLQPLSQSRLETKECDCMAANINITEQLIQSFHGNYSRHLVQGSDRSLHLAHFKLINRFHPLWSKEFGATMTQFHLLHTCAIKQCKDGFSFDCIRSPRACRVLSACKKTYRNKHVTSCRQAKLPFKWTTANLN